MTKQEIALQIFLKRMPSERFNDESRKGFISAAEQAGELADLFMYVTGAGQVCADVSERIPEDEL